MTDHRINLTLYRLDIETMEGQAGYAIGEPIVQEHRGDLLATYIEQE